MPAQLFAPEHPIGSPERERIDPYLWTEEDLRKNIGMARDLGMEPYQSDGGYRMRPIQDSPFSTAVLQPEPFIAPPPEDAQNQPVPQASNPFQKSPWTTDPIPFTTDLSGPAGQYSDAHAARVQQYQNELDSAEALRNRQDMDKLLAAGFNPMSGQAHADVNALGRARLNETLRRNQALEAEHQAQMELSKNRFQTQQESKLPEFWTANQLNQTTLDSGEKWHERAPNQYVKVPKTELDLTAERKARLAQKNSERVAPAEPAAPQMPVGQSPFGPPAIISPSPAPAVAPKYPPMPSDREKLSLGQTYILPDGKPGTWLFRDGKYKFFY